jgi:hypothetical protein
MGLNTVQEIERAIGTLTPEEMDELWLWLDRCPHPLDTRIRTDLSSGRLDQAIQRALKDEQNDRVQPL